jgi:hypothetical protein
MDRRLTIAVIGLVMVLDMVLMAWLTAIGKDIPSELAGVLVFGLGALVPSPLSKTSVAPDVDGPVKPAG